jgi:tRNA nucleotidyltransferase (CCA-adding enzyme)
LVEDLCARLKAPNEFRDLARMTALYHGKVHRALELRLTTVLELLEDVDALRRPERFEQLLLACEADHRGRTGYEDRPYPQAERLRAAHAAIAAIDTRAVIGGLRDGEAIKQRLREARLAALHAALD